MSRLNILVKDAMTGARMIEAKDAVALPSPDDTLNESRMGNLLVWERTNAHKDRNLYGAEKRFREALESALLLKSEIRSSTCWMPNCPCIPRSWVFEIGFDRKELKAQLEFAQVNSAAYPPPTPGFCLHHLQTGSAQLAEKVYFDQTPVKWGYLPTRWFCRFTSGDSTRGPIQQINPKMFQPKVIETYQKGAFNG